MNYTISRPWTIDRVVAECIENGEVIVSKHPRERQKRKQIRRALSRGLLFQDHGFTRAGCERFVAEPLKQARPQIEPVIRPIFEA